VWAASNELHTTDSGQGITCQSNDTMLEYVDKLKCLDPLSVQTADRKGGVKNGTR
jgi:hypothetical protein